MLGREYICRTVSSEQNKTKRKENVVAVIDLTHLNICYYLIMFVMQSYRLDAL